MAMWNNTGAIYAPYKNAQRTANKLQSKDQPENPGEFFNRGQAIQRSAPISQRKPLQKAILGAQDEPTMDVNPNISGNAQNSMEAPSRTPTPSYASSRYSAQNPLDSDGVPATSPIAPVLPGMPPPGPVGDVQQPPTASRAPRASMDQFGNFAGFDAKNYEGEDRDKSAKYTFADAASASGYVPQTKQEAEQWANQFVVPELEARGYKVHWVQGDKMMVSTRENPQGEVIDFIQGADGADPKFAWQPESGGDPSAAGGMDPLGQAIVTPTNPLTAGAETSGSGDAYDAMMQDPRWRQMLRDLGIQV